jgi:hypothetical protein
MKSLDGKNLEDEKSGEFSIMVALRGCQLVRKLIVDDMWTSNGIWIFKVDFISSC